MAAYEKWSGSELQYTTWLGDMCDEVFKVELVKGNTMIIPSGWIHAVVCVFSVASRTNLTQIIQSSIHQWIH